MHADPKRPLSVVLCGNLIQVAARLVPPAQRAEWSQEWLAEIWHQWQFLQHADGWNKREGWRLLVRCLGALPDAGWHFTAQDAVQHRWREAVRSPWTCLAAWAAAVGIIAVLSSGLAATRDLFHKSENGQGRLVFIWLHPSAGGGDKGLPADVSPAWSRHSQLLAGAASFHVGHQDVNYGGRASRLLVVTADAQLFPVLHVRPAWGDFPRETGVVLTYPLWESLFHSNRNVLGTRIRVDRESYRVAAVLARNFQFLSRQPALYVVQPVLVDGPNMMVARTRPGVAVKNLDRELTRIAEVSCYYFFHGDLRYEFLDEAAWIPVQIFAVSVLVSALLLIAVSRVRLHHFRAALRHPDRTSLMRRVGFSTAKTFLALAFVFVAGLEWSRSDSAILFGSRDPANGPFLLWLYVLGAMAVLFWSVADQHARCRVCLRLLCFPVRIGCPGCLLLDWSGTELLCTEGHGVLHVPHMAPSWDEQPGHWIALDESWKELFAGENRGT